MLLVSLTITQFVTVLDMFFEGLCEQLSVWLKCRLFTKETECHTFQWLTLPRIMSIYM